MEKIENYISFDLEFNTAGERHHLIQVSAVKFIQHEEVETFDSFVYSELPLPAFINGLTGITKEKIDNAPRVEEVLKEFKSFVGELPLIGYSARNNDLPILLENGLDLEAQYVVDVFEEAQLKRSNDLNGVIDLKLTTVAKYFDIPGHGHNALDDARMTALVYEKFLELEENKKYVEQLESKKEESSMGNLFSGVDLSSLFD
ncbi:MAG: 3'-5' exonuclease [Streptococcaceae bacterium]|jgi:DNA polymerase-3 subunit epsilon|nr:3'-5' exonuclease [Streptococcaceae bacterium]